MTFDITERSNYGGAPVTLYEFRRSGQVFRYANAESNVSDGGQTFEAISITDNGLRQSSDSRSDEVIITLQRDAAINDLWRNVPPSEEVQVIIRRKHLGTTFSSVVWSGFVDTHTGVDILSAEITARSALASLKRLGLRLSYSRQCPYALYDRSCKVNKTNYAVTLQVSVVQGNRVNCAGANAYPNDWFKGGFLEMAVQGATERRGIEWHTGNNMGILEGTDGISVGMVITLYPGCERTTSVCINKFSNLLNYGGVPTLPDQSPFDSNPF